MVDILFVTSTGQLRLADESNGTMILATLLRQAGISTQILRFAQCEQYDRDYEAFICEITDKILATAPRCVSFYTLWPYYHIMLRIAKELKQRQKEIVIVFGGPQASLTAQATLNAAPYVDYVCCGEGELTAVPFFSALLNGNTVMAMQVPGACGRDGSCIMICDETIPLCDLNDIPMWDEQLYCNDYTELKEKLTSSDYFMPINVGRGCPYSCTFCCTSKFWRRAYRLRTADRLIAEIKYYKEQYGITSFWFSHDAFTVNAHLVEEICQRIIDEDLNIRWRCASRIDRVTENLLLKMKQAGMVEIEFGIETGSLDMQKRINKKLDLKHAKSMVQFLLSEKIKVCPFFMYGFPDETEEELAQTLALQFDLLDMGVKRSSMSFCMFNPDTAITKEYFDKLELDSACKIIPRGVFGYEEELSVIAAHKDIFPFFFHLNTELRNKYQYLTFFSYAYQQYPITAKYLRTLYAGNELKFYRDFYNANEAIFEGTIQEIQEKAIYQTEELWHNLLQSIDIPCSAQIEGIFRYESDLRRISSAEDGAQIRSEYPFVWVEFLMKLPLDKLSRGRSVLLLKKEQGKISRKLLEMQ